MKKLGLVGGMGPESTLEYYREINHGVQRRLGRDEFPELAIESVNLFHTTRLLNERRYGELTEYMLAAIRRLALCGADFAALTANTPHIIFDELAEKTPIPLVSIVAASAAEAKRRGYGRIGLMGTIFTMRGDFFQKPFRAAGIDVVTPDEAEMEYINRRLFSEIELGVIKPDVLPAFQRIIERMRRENNIEAVALGCTELPLVLGDEVSPVPCLDTMAIHIETLIDMILEEEKI